MPTKQELLQDKTKAELLDLAKKAGATKAKTSMRKGELVDVLANSRKLTKADIQDN